MHFMGLEIDSSPERGWELECSPAASNSLFTLPLNLDVLTAALKVFLQTAFPARTPQVLFRTSWGVSILFLELKSQIRHSPALVLCLHPSPGSFPNSASALPEAASMKKLTTCERRNPGYVCGNPGKHPTPLPRLELRGGGDSWADS